MNDYYSCCLFLTYVAGSSGGQPEGREHLWRKRGTELWPPPHPPPPPLFYHPPPTHLRGNNSTTPPPPLLSLPPHHPLWGQTPQSRSAAQTQRNTLGEGRGSEGLGVSAMPPWGRGHPGLGLSMNPPFPFTPNFNQVAFRILSGRGVEQRTAARGSPRHCFAFSSLLFPLFFPSSPSPVLFFPSSLSILFTIIIIIIATLFLAVLSTPSPAVIATKRAAKGQRCHLRQTHPPNTTTNVTPAPLGTPRPPHTPKMENKH